MPDMSLLLPIFFFPEPLFYLNHFIVLEHKIRFICLIFVIALAPA